MLKFAHNYSWHKRVQKKTRNENLELIKVVWIWHVLGEANRIWFVWLLRKMLLTEDCLIEMLERFKLWCKQICHFNCNRYFADNFYEPHLSLVAHSFDCHKPKNPGRITAFLDKKIYGILHSATANPARTTSNVLQFIHRGTFWNDETCHYCAEYSWKWVEARLPLDRRSFVRARGLYNPER